MRYVRKCKSIYVTNGCIYQSVEISFTGAQTGGGFSSPRNSSHIENALDGTIAWRGDESDDDRYAESDEEDRRERKKKRRKEKKYSDEDEDDYDYNKKRKIEEAEAVISFLMMMKMEVVIEVDPGVKEGGKAVAEKYTDDETDSGLDSPRTRSDRRRRRKQRY